VLLLFASPFVISSSSIDGTDESVLNNSISDQSGVYEESGTVIFTSRFKMNPLRVSKWLEGHAPSARLFGR
jgi:hypothetical protein